MIQYGRASGRGAAREARQRTRRQAAMQSGKAEMPCVVLYDGVSDIV